jgi:hypothetical protein
MKRFLNEIYLLLIIISLFGCASKENPEKKQDRRNPPTEVSPSPTPESSPSPNPPNGQKFAAPTKFRLEQRTDTSLSFSWAEDYSGINPEIYVRLSYCYVQACSDSDFVDYDIFFGSSSQIFGLIPDSTYSVRIRSEKSAGSASDWVYLNNLKTLPLADFFVYKNGLTGKDQLGSYDISFNNVSFSQEKELFQILSNQRFSYIFDFLILPLTDISTGLTKLYIENKALGQYQEILGDYIISSSNNISSIAVIENGGLDFFPPVYFVADSPTELKSLYKVSYIDGALVAEKNTLFKNVTEIVKSSDKLYFIADDLVFTNKRTVYSLNDSGDCSSVFESPDGFEVKDLKFGDFLGYVLKYDPISLTASIIQIDSLLGSVVSELASEPLDAGFGLALENNVFISKTKTNGDFYVFDEFLEDFTIQADSISDVRIIDRILTLVSSTDSSSSLLKQEKIFDQNEDLVSISTEIIPSVLKDANSEIHSYFVENQDLFFIKIDAEGSGRLSKTNLGSFTMSTDIGSALADDISDSGIIFVSGKIFYVTKDNKLVSVQISDQTRIVEVDLPGATIQNGSIIEHNFLNTGGRFLVGLETPLNLLGHTELTIFSIDSTGSVSPVFSPGQFSQNEFSSFKFLMRR